MKENENRKIVFYDGDCSFCNRIVQFILVNNTREDLYFASLQSEFSLEFFGEFKTNLSTFYFYDDYQIYSKSKAAIRLSRYLSRPYSFVRIATLIPVCFRDKVYDFIANRRTRINKNFCIQLTDAEKKRFID